MEGGDHSLVPQWLKSSGNVSRVAVISSSYSDHTNYSGCRWNSSSKGPRFSRSYSSSERSLHDRDCEKDSDNFLHKDKLFLGERNHDHSDFVENKLSNRFEKDLLQRSQSMNYERREIWSPRTSGYVSNQQKNHRKSDGSVTGVVGIMHKTVLDEEFPILGAEDKLGSSELGSLLSSSSSTSSHNLLTGTSVMTTSNGLIPASQDIPMTVGSNNIAIMTHQQHNVSTSTSSTALGTIGLSMAETLAQGPPRSCSPPQLSASTQKLEELALKQSRLLVPMTPSTPRSMVKSGQQQYPFSYSRRPNHSLHGAHPNSDIQKISSGYSHNVSASRELNGVGATTSTSTSAPSRSSSNNSTHSAWITLEKKPTLPTQSRNDFFKNLSRKSSSKKPCSDVFPVDMSCALEKSEASTRNVTSCPIMKSRDTPSVDTSSANMLTYYSSIVTEKVDPTYEPLELSNNGEKQYSTDPVLYPDEEEIAFLRSLGWEESAGDDEGLTEEEIRDFYEKYMKLQL